MTNAEPRGRHWRGDVQGLRAIAVLLVVLFHVGAGVPGGFVGVDVFFVLSGFVIGSLLLRELAATNRISFRRFYVRRVRRLLPALALLSIVTAVAAALILSPLGGRQQATAGGIVSASGFVANFYFLLTSGGYFQQAAQDNPFLHTWTLSVEEQFYLVFPLFLLLGWRLRNRFSTKWLIGWLAAGLAVSLAVSVVLSYELVPALSIFTKLAEENRASRLGFYGPFGRGWEFLAGTLVALVPGRWALPRWAATTASMAGLLLIAAAAMRFNSTDPFPGVLAAVPVLGTVLVLAAGFGARPSIVTRTLGFAPIRWLGDVSYGWYLWHWPAIVFARALFPDVSGAAAWAAAAALVPTVLSYELVEQPIRRGRRWPSARATMTMAAVCLAAPVTCGLGLAVAAGHAWWRPDIATLQAETRPEHTDLLSGCASFAPLGASDRPACIWPVAHAKGTILLIGDSNAGHLGEPLIAAAHALGYDAQLATAGGCPFLSRPVYFTPACRHFVEGSLAAIAAVNPAYAAVVISNATVGYVDGSLAPTFAADIPSGAGPAHRVDRRVEIEGWVDSLGRTVAAVRPHSPVIVVGAVPQFDDLPRCLRPSIFSGPRPGCGHLDANAAAYRRSDVIGQERAAAIGLGATYLDTGDRLCTPAAGCAAFVDGTFVYRDGAHLGVSGSMIFEPDLHDALARVLNDASRARP